MAQEIARALNKWGFEDLSGRALLDDRAAREHDDVIGDATGEIRFVGDRQQGHALVLRGEGAAQQRVYIRGKMRGPGGS